MAALCKEGKLSKYTNVMKGWQNRYFILNPASGVFEYHINQNELSNYPTKPRGSLLLDGAVIAPSMEDSCTFSVNASNGEVYKLRAINAKERQDWVAQLRNVSEMCTSQVAEDHPPLSASTRKPRTKSLVSNLSKLKDQVQQFSGPPPSSSSHKLSSSCNDFRGRSGSHSSITRVFPTTDVRGLPKPDEKSELKESWESLMSTENYLAGLCSQLENLPFQNQVQASYNQTKSSGDDGEEAVISFADKEVALMKCTAAAAFQSLSSAYTELYSFKQQADSILPPGAQISWNKKSDPGNKSTEDVGSSSSATLHECPSTTSNSKPSVVIEPQLANPTDEVKDEVEVADKQDDDAVEENKNVVVHLISQLKLGMDLTKVALPTFILEKRSLLEMYADFNSCTHLLRDIASAPTPLHRMNNVLKFYLTSFYTGRKGNYSKKPYNPVLGEVFQCSFYVEKNDSSAKTTLSQSPPDSGSHDRFRFVAEQVSHHPPISAMHLSCDDLDIHMTSYIWTKSKFMNMSVGVSNIGEGCLSLRSFGEDYVITYPSAYARSLLTEPWSELTGRCTIICEKSGLTSNVVFHTKPAYGGEPHKVSAEVKTSSGLVLTKVTGKWNQQLKFTYVEEGNERIENIDVTTLPVHPKYIRSIEKQDEMESRKFWRPVTKALEDRKLTEASEFKSKIEERQRQMAKERADNNFVMASSFFAPVEGKQQTAYVFKGPPMSK